MDKEERDINEKRDPLGEQSGKEDSHGQIESEIQAEKDAKDDIKIDDEQKVEIDKNIEKEANVDTDADVQDEKHEEKGLELWREQDEVAVPCLEFEEQIESKHVTQEKKGEQPFEVLPGVQKRRSGRTTKLSRRKLILMLVVFLFLLSLLSGGGFFLRSLYEQYRQYVSLAQSGAQQLRLAIGQLQALPEDGLDLLVVDQAKQEFVTAFDDFIQVRDGLNSLPSISTSIPAYGSRLTAALHVLPLAIIATQAGQHACTILETVLARVHEPLDLQNQGLTTEDINIINNEFAQIKALFGAATHQIQDVQPGDLQLDPRLNKAITEFQKYLPMVRTWMNQAEQLLPMLPTLLGIGQPTRYLVEILDSTELRPGGGFIGNYGFVTLAGGRLTNTTITDTYLLDKASYNAGHTIPFPSQYQWFDLAGSGWSLRDSNLDADFPTAARYSEQIYKQEGGTMNVEGVIAITPVLISNILTITGPISVPEYHEIVTSQNLIERIHYYQLGAGRVGNDIPSPDGHSSVRKHFTELLAEHLFARFRQLPLSSLSALSHLLLSSLHTKDIQVYLNSQIAENLLSAYDLDSTIQHPASDSLLVVDANISGSKANALITNTLNDQAVIDQNGDVTHYTTLSYAWTKQGDVYGSSLYRDYLRVYTPPGSKLLTQDGWEPRGSSTAFARNVWAGFFTLTSNQTHTITLTWTVPGGAQKDAKGWHYQYLVQRQAGAQWTLHLQINLSAGMMLTNQSGLQARSSSVLVLDQSLDGDMNVQMSFIDV